MTTFYSCSTYSAGWNISYHLPDTEYVFFLCMYKEKQLNYLKLVFKLERSTILFHNLYLGYFFLMVMQWHLIKNKHKQNWSAKSSSIIPNAILAGLLSWWGWLLVSTICFQKKKIYCPSKFPIKGIFIVCAFLTEKSQDIWKFLNKLQISF